MRCRGWSCCGWIFSVAAVVDIGDGAVAVGAIAANIAVIAVGTGRTIVSDLEVLAWSD